MVNSHTFCEPNLCLSGPSLSKGLNLHLFGKTLEKGGDKEGKQGKIWDNLGGNVTHLSTSEDNV